MNVWPQDPPIISIMVYYTPEFEQEFSNPLSVIKSYVAATNDAFKRSGLKEVRLKLHCIEKLSITDNEWDLAETRLTTFENAKGTLSNLLQSADVALLVTKSGVSIQKVQIYYFVVAFKMTRIISILKFSLMKEQCTELHGLELLITMSSHTLPHQLVGQREVILSYLPMSSAIY